MDLQSEDKICRKNEEQRPCRKGAGLLPFRTANGLWRTLLVVLTIGLGATACKDDDDEVIPTELTPTGASAAYFTEGMTFPVEGGDVKLTFTVNEAWTATIATEAMRNWCFLSVNDGEAGDVELTVSATRNEALYREAVITLAAGTLERTVTVKQTGSDVVTLNVGTAGTLPELIGEESQFAITELTLSGELNGTDILFLREMAGAGRTDEEANSTRILQKLNLTNARIVEGGECFYTDAQGNNHYSVNDELPDYAFANCSSLTEVQLPTSARRIGANAFRQCGNLTSVTIPNGIVSIGDHAFGWCENLTSADIPNSVTSIEDAAFIYCDRLSSVRLPNSIESLAHSLFYECHNLASVTIPQGAKVIETNAFYMCGSLVNIEIPNTVTEIGQGAFANCTSLVSVTIPNSVTTIGDGAFTNCALVNVNLPSSVTELGPRAFSWCRSLVGINIPSSVTTIKLMTFSGCTSLASVSMTNVRSIEQGAFEESLISSITLPATLQNLSHSAFNNCPNLREIHMRSNTPPAIVYDEGTQTLTNQITLYIPQGSRNAYMASTDWPMFWYGFRDVIEE